VATELTCVLTALAREGLFLRPRLRPLCRVAGSPCPAWLGMLGRARVLLLQSGMGAAATRRALEWAFRLEPERVIAAGFCGALGPLPVGALVRPREVLDEQGTTWPLAQGEGRLVSVAVPALSLARRRQLREQSGAVAVDMESATAARLCQQRVRFSCLRVISDAADADLAAELADLIQGEQIAAGRLLGAILRRPGLVRELWRLERQSRRAARSLADGLEQLLGRPGTQTEAVTSVSAG
jgi:nucleoside phosphorylase